MRYKVVSKGCMGCGTQVFLATNTVMVHEILKTLHDLRDSTCTATYVVEEIKELPDEGDRHGKS